MFNQKASSATSEACLFNAKTKEFEIMTEQKLTIQELLNRSAFLVRKYNLGNEQIFYNKFSKFPDSDLQHAWAYALKQVQNREIVKDASVQFDQHDSLQISLRVIKLGSNIGLIHDALMKKFDVRELKLSDENMERRTRHMLASRYLDLALTAAKKEWRLANPTLTDWLTNFAKKHTTAIVVLSLALALGGLSTPRIIDGFTPPEILLNHYLESEYPKIEARPITQEVLANFLREDTRYKTSGSICRDGWISTSTGQGSCSWHGGVRHRYREGDYSLTVEQSQKNASVAIDRLRTKALEISWKD
ncbi:MAG: hypothetical protein ACKVQW_07940 [Pyrinomonadaceae bacterium]